MDRSKNGGWDEALEYSLKHLLSQISWLLDPMLDQVGEDELMRLGQEMVAKKGIV